MSGQAPYIRKQSALEVLRRHVGEVATPLSAMIEIADRCNEVCLHCYQVQGQKGEMTTAQVKGVIDELAEMGVLFLIISGGEPTLRRDFLEIVEHARQRRFAVKLYTNGLTMTPELAQRLAELAVQEVHLSLYSSRPDVHDWVTKVPGSWSKTVNAARMLVDVGLKVIVKTPLMTVNVEDYAEYRVLTEALGADHSFNLAVNAREDGTTDPTALEISKDEYVQVMRDPRVGQTVDKEPEVPVSASPCSACSAAVHVEANGELRPCALMTVPVGNALDPGGIRGAWERNESAVTIRSLTYADIHGCRICDLRAYCSRCYADSMQLGGDALGPYARACASARSSYEAIRGRRPKIDTSAQRSGNADLGPYRRVAAGEFILAADELGAEDLELRRRHPWIHNPDHSAPRQPAPARSGELVQLRRPGKKRRPERVPSAGARG